jgi:GT2 family glycosyltransferase
MSSAPPVISFIIVNRNGANLLRDCLDSIRKQSVNCAEVVVIDNGSSDHSCDLPHFQDNNWCLIRLQSNIGFSPACNMALQHCHAPYIALINNDTVLDKDWVRYVLEEFTRFPAAGSVATNILQSGSPELLDSAGFTMFACGTVTSWRGHPAGYFDHKIHAPTGPVASAAAYRRSAIDITGLFHDEYFAYYEDTDLAIRLLLFGYKCRFSSLAVAYHIGSFTGARWSSFHRYHLRRNIELLYWVDMTGSVAWRHLLPHFLYETACFFNMLMHGQALTFIRAKLDALQHFSWIRSQRHHLKEKLSSCGRLNSAVQDLESSLLPSLQAFLPDTRSRTHRRQTQQPKAPNS